MPNKKKRGKRRAPYLSDMYATRVRDALEHISAHKKEYIINENGAPVSIREAARRYKETGDDKWLLHILFSNLGYFANTLGKFAARYNADPRDYIHYIYDGLKYSLGKCDPDRVKISYLASGVYITFVREINRENRKKRKEVDIERLTYAEAEEEEVPTSGEYLDRLFADFDIYDVPLYDEDTH